MEEQPLTLAELLDQAAAASRLGDREEAEQLYRRATERSPANTRAWLGLAGAVESLTEKRACFERVLAINPNNGEARVALQRLAALTEGEDAKQIQAVLTESAARSAAAPFPPPPPAAVDDEQAQDHPAEATAVGEALFCANHPQTETTLRCNRCGKPVCVRCVELTEVGYRCKECIREQRGIFYNAQSADYWIVAVVSFALAMLAAPLIGVLLGFFGLFGWIIAFILGPTVGGIAATAIRRAVGRRRGRYMGLIAVAAIIFGALIGSVLIGSILGLRVNLLITGLFVTLALGTVYATLR